MESSGKVQSTVTSRSPFWLVVNDGKKQRPLTARAHDPLVMMVWPGASRVGVGEHPGPAGVAAHPPLPPDPPQPPSVRMRASPPASLSALRPAFIAFSPSGGRDQALDLGVEHSPGVRVLEERVRRPVRRGEKDDATRVRRETRDDGRSGGRRRGPEKENRTYALQRRVERLGHGEVTRHDLDGRRQPRRCRPARERAHRHARVQQLGDHRAPDPARGSRHADGMQVCACHEGLARPPEPEGRPRLVDANEAQGPHVEPLSDRPDGVPIHVQPGIP